MKNTFFNNSLEQEDFNLPQEWKYEKINKLFKLIQSNKFNNNKYK